MQVILLTTLFLTLITGAWAQSSAQQRKEKAAIEVLKLTVKNLATLDLSCTKTSECAAVALGSMACGGPADFTLASLRNANIEEIAYLAERTSIKESEYNRKYNIRSTCEILLAPKVVCSYQTCNREITPSEFDN